MRERGVEYYVGRFVGYLGELEVLRGSFGGGGDWWLCEGDGSGGVILNF